MIINEKIKNFLSLLHDEIELQNSGFVSIKYRELSSVLGDGGVEKYLEYLEKQGIIKLKFISKQTIKNKKVPNNTYISKVKPDNEIILPEQFYEVKRYYKINFYPEDFFVFNYDKQKIQKVIDRKLDKPEINLPTSLRVIEEYLYILNQIEEEGQKTPEGEWIKHHINQGMFARGVPVGEHWTNILKILNQGGIIKLKDINLNDGAYSTYLMPTERFQEYKETLNKKSKKDAKTESVKIQGGKLSRTTKTQPSVKIQQKKRKTLSTKKTMKPPIFDKEKSRITLGDEKEKCEIPFDTIEYCLCKVMFEKEKDKPISWDEIREEYEGSEKAELMKPDSIYDAIRRVNKKAKKKLNIKKLFAWEERSVKRLA